MEELKKKLEYCRCTGYQCRCETSDLHYVVGLETIQNLLSQALQKRDETFLEILEDNKKETMWVGEDAQKIAEESIYNFVEAVKTKLSTLTK